MKLRTSLSATLLLVGGISASSAFGAAPGVISSAVSNPGSYCHLKFPAIREETLSWNRPVLKDASGSDIIDFYGACDYDPLGKDEIARQKQEANDLYDKDND